VSDQLVSVLSRLAHEVARLRRDVERGLSELDQKLEMALGQARGLEQRLSELEEALEGLSSAVGSLRSSVRDLEGRVERGLSRVLEGVEGLSKQVSSLDASIRSGFGTLYGHQRELKEGLDGLRGSLRELVQIVPQSIEEVRENLGRRLDAVRGDSLKAIEKAEGSILAGVRGEVDKVLEVLANVRGLLEEARRTLAAAVGDLGSRMDARVGELRGALEEVRKEGLAALKEARDRVLSEVQQGRLEVQVAIGLVEEVKALVGELLATLYTLQLVAEKGFSDVRLAVGLEELRSRYGLWGDRE